ncbi:PAP2 domain-containing protein [Phyllosticta citribraziliensis]|uniref:PAP2 domain-containing protein n=1 Tax=Phyllosticta citribraziliensis TaxID=989973 RepID=A0ABR1LLC9_9PEZI
MRAALALPSKRLVASYVFDWFIIFAMAAVGGGWSTISPYHRPFSLLDLDIAFPHDNTETIPVWLLIVLGLFVPAGIIFLVCLFFVPGPTANKQTPKSLIWRRKFWEWNAGWMGLGLSLATTYLITQGMKNLFGKPRPDLLSRCQPDLQNVGDYAVGGFGQDISNRWTLVNSAICQQQDSGVLDDGFRSFPSGHASFAWSGLLYLTFFLCSKFAIAIPFLPPRPYSLDATHTAIERRQSFALPLYNSPNASTIHKPTTDGAHDLSPPSSSAGLDTAASPATGIVPIRNQAAAPPTYTLVLAVLPVAAAVFISASRYFDFRHHGFDILFGSLLGIAMAWLSFRWYHLPIREGAGWAWGARSRNRAWGVGVGVLGYVGSEGWGPKKGDGVVGFGLGRSNARNGDRGMNGVAEA